MFVRVFKSHCCVQLCDWQCFLFCLLSQELCWCHQTHPSAAVQERQTDSLSVCLFYKGFHWEHYLWHKNTSSKHFCEALYSSQINPFNHLMVTHRYHLLPLVIHSSETGFIEGRHSANNTKYNRYCSNKLESIWLGKDFQVFISSST